MLQLFFTDSLKQTVQNKPKGEWMIISSELKKAIKEESIPFDGIDSN